MDKSESLRIRDVVIFSVIVVLGVATGYVLVATAYFLGVQV